MKTNRWKTMIASMVILPMALVSCHDEWIPGIIGEGDIIEQTIDPDNFDGFVSDIHADIYVTQGIEQKVVIRAQQNIIDNIDTDRVEAGIWTIRYHRLVGYAKPVEIFITIPDLTKAGINGSGDIMGLTSFTGLGDLKLFIAGSGSMDLNTESKKLDITVAGSGDLRMYGTTEKLSVLIAGSGSLRGPDLICRQAEMTISGSGSARLSVEDFLKVTVTGSGKVHYYGNPEVDVQVTGSGSVIREQ